MLKMNELGSVDESLMFTGATGVERMERALIKCTCCSHIALRFPCSISGKVKASKINL